MAGNDLRRRPQVVRDTISFSLQIYGAAYRNRPDTGSASTFNIARAIAYHPRLREVDVKNIPRRKEEVWRWLAA
jgi:hypothetical protein